MVADCPTRIVTNVLNQFIFNLFEEDTYIIPTRFLDIPKRVILIEAPYCMKSKAFSKLISKEFQEFTYFSCMWLFEIRSKIPHACTLMSPKSERPRVM